MTESEETRVTRTTTPADPGRPPAGFVLGLDGRGGATLVYILYAVGFFFPVAALAGVVLAYVDRGRNEPWIDGHYTFQIRTFWIGVALLALGGITSMILIGFLVLLVWLIWTLVRIITGLQKLMRGSPVADPTSSGFTA